ncbi:hypothetical protein JCM9957A_29310 [Kineosporia succinea]
MNLAHVPRPREVDHWKQASKADTSTDAQRRGQARTKKKVLGLDVIPRQKTPGR